ncbi:hypothetical protein BDR07DRAFT_1411726 [Suillus spraguei]|nr:hypothetical protein BDR07DRAFT_1411726 [Suillus spraguei]
MCAQAILAFLMVIPQSMFQWNIMMRSSRVVCAGFVQSCSSNQKGSAYHLNSCWVLHQCLMMRRFMLTRLQYRGGDG